ncbi:MAG: helix-turn-helix transcriptional regulator [Bacteroidales bacterium]|jgi:transcriptional regulator with XRE-family HTH domain
MKRKVIEPGHIVLLKELGIRIKKLRTDKNIGYIQMAKDIGLSKNSYNSIELGNSYCNFLSILRIADYHHVSVSTLLSGL